MMSNHYTYRAEWSPEDDEFVGLVAEFPSLSWLASTPADAVDGASQLVDGILADMAHSGEKPPVPLTERRYSGNLTIRTSPAQHRALTIEAAEQRVSVNQWVNHKLSVASSSPAPVPSESWPAAGRLPVTENVLARIGAATLDGGVRAAIASAAQGSAPAALDTSGLFESEGFKAAVQATVKAMGIAGATTSGESTTEPGALPKG